MMYIYIWAHLMCNTVNGLYTVYNLCLIYVRLPCRNLCLLSWTWEQWVDFLVQVPRFWTARGASGWRYGRLWCPWMLKWSTWSLKCNEGCSAIAKLKNVWNFYLWLEALIRFYPIYSCSWVVKVAKAWLSLLLLSIVSMVIANSREFWPTTAWRPKLYS